MKLLFVRHGQTDWNKEKKLMGRTDIPLNDEGIKQAHEVAQTINPDFDALFSSPLKRAYETAEIIAQEYDKPIIIKAELAERDFGSLAGKTWDQIQEVTGVDMRAITKEEKYDYRPYGGESAADVQERILHFVKEVRQQEYVRAVVVCHSGVISMMRLLFPQQEVMAITNTSVHEFDI